jgi:hypothetical protein
MLNSSVTDPHCLYADPDLAFSVNANPDPSIRQMFNFIQNNGILNHFYTNYVHIAFHTFYG